MKTKAITTLMLAFLLTSMFSISNVFAATTSINFDTYSTGTLIENQYQSEGVVFSSKGYIWSTSESQSLPNFLVGYPATYPPTHPWAIYPITFEFVVPGTSTSAATGSVTVTLISVGHSTVTATAYDSSSTVLSTISVTNPSGPSNGLNNKDTITFSGVGSISKVDILITTPYPGSGDYPDSYAGDGFGIDDLSFEATIPVDIDIKPGSDPNSINLGSKGTIPVAILSTENFDATTVDPASVELEGARVGQRGKSNKLMASIEDVNSDGRLDLVVHIETAELALSTGDIEAILTGLTYDGTTIMGTDSIRIVPP